MPREGRAPSCSEDPEALGRYLEPLLSRRQRPCPVRAQPQVAKASRELREGDVVELRRQLSVRTLVVRAVSRQRGPATDAQALYEETAESVARREREAAERKLHREPASTIAQGRPTKRDRRQLADWDRWSASADPD